MVQGSQKGAPPFVLQLDLQMDAPVIMMPRFSDSSDNVKVDLGAVHLSNSVGWRSGNSLSDPQACCPPASGTLDDDLPSLPSFWPA